MNKRIFRLTKIKMRCFYWISVILLMVFIVCPMFFFFYLFDEDQVKQMLYDQFDNNNYHVEVMGKIVPRFWHGLSLEVNDLGVSTNKDIELLHIKTANCQLSWLDLVFARYKIKRMALNDVDINEKNIREYGLNNLLTMPNLGKSTFSRLNNMSIFGINSIDKDAPYPIKDGLFTIEQTSDGAVYKLGFELANNGVFIASEGVMNAISSDVIKFSDFSASIYDASMRINFSANTSYHLLEKQLTLDNTSGSLDFSNYKGEFSVAKTIFSLDNMSLNNLNLNLNFDNAFAHQAMNLQLSSLNIPNYKEYKVGEARINYLIGIQQNKVELRSILNQIKINNSDIISKDCQNQLSYSSSTRESNKLNAVLSGVCQYNFKQYLLNLNAIGSLNQAPLKLELAVSNSGEKPKIVVNGIIDNLDLSPFGVGKDKLLPFYYDDSALPFSWLSLFDMEGQLNVRRFSLDRIHLNDVSTNFKLYDDVLNITKLHANVYQGTLSGSAKIAKLDNGYDISTLQTINNLDLKEMFQDLFDVGAISGKANLKIDASTSNAYSYADLHERLNGKITVDANHGAFQGVDFNIFSASNSLAPNKSTIFEKLNAELNFINGVSKVGNVTFYSPYLIANGSGVIDFVDTTLDYVLTIKSTLPPNEQKISSVVIPVAAKGDLFDPQISIQNIHLFTGGSKVLREQVPHGHIDKKSSSKDTAKHKANSTFAPSGHVGKNSNGKSANKHKSTNLFYEMGIGI